MPAPDLTPPPLIEEDDRPIKGEIKFLKTELANWVTMTSSSANNVIDSASATLTTMITKQIAQIEKEQAAGRLLPITLE